MKLNFYLEKSKDKLRSDGKAKLYLFISHDGRRYKVTTKLSISPSLWNPKRQEIKGGIPEVKDLNDYLKSLKDEVEYVYAKACRTFKVPDGINGSYDRFKITPGWIKNELSFISKYTYFEEMPDGRKVPRVQHKTEISFFDIWEEFAKERSGRWVKSTAQNFSTLRDRLEKINNEYEINFQTINNDFLIKFIEYHVAKGSNNSLIRKHLIMLHSFLNWATGKEYNKNLAYQKAEWREEIRNRLPLPEKKANIVFLTVEEYHKFRTVRLPDETLNYVRDLFLFGIYTGLRQGDIFNLKKSDIGKDGWIDIITTKDKKIMNKPLSKFALALIKKYSFSSSEYIFPAIHDPSPYVRVIAKRAGIKERVKMIKTCGKDFEPKKGPKCDFLKFHDSRKTYTTYNETYLELPAALCHELTGHSNGTGAHQRYVGVDRQIVINAVNKFDQLLEPKLAA